MKLAIAVGLLVLSISASAQGPKPFKGKEIKIISSYVNQYKVRLITAYSDDATPTPFIFYCNEDVCNAPRANGLYVLVAPYNRVYKCDEYILAYAHDNTENFRACLGNVD